MKINQKDIAQNGIIAALYVVLCLISYPISFMGLQFRIAETLIILPFFNRKYSLGLVVGCLITNVASPIFPYDILFGTAATLLACVFMMLVNKLGIALLFTIFINAVLVGLELNLKFSSPFIEYALYVSVGEAVVLLVGYICVLLLKKNPNFYKTIKANRNIDFVW